MKASELRLYHRLQVAAHRLRKTADRLLIDDAGLTTAQAAVLAIAARGTPVTQRDVAELLSLNESAVTAMVSRLIALGMLRRTRSATDGRAWLLSLSEQGRAARRKAQQSFANVNARIEASLSTREIEHLADYLDRLSAGVAGHDL